jgi:Holliday junction DNA helicase RuvB
MLTGPLRDRFGIVSRLETYSTQELGLIIRRSAAILGFDIETDASLELASRSRGTPRIANRLLKRIRDFAQVSNSKSITLDITKTSLVDLDVDELGLDMIDKKILSCIIQKFNGGPVGLDTLAAATNEEAITIEDVVEPFLIQLGFISRSPRGRIVLPSGFKHMGATPPSIIEQLKFD